MSYRETFLRVEKMLYGGLAHEPHYSLTPRNAVSDRGKAPTADIAPRLIPDVRPTADDPLKSGQPISRVGRRCNVCPPLSAVHAEARLGGRVWPSDIHESLYGRHLPSRGKGK